MELVVSLMARARRTLFVGRHASKTTATFKMNVKDTRRSFQYIFTYKYCTRVPCILVQALDCLWILTAFQHNDARDATVRLKTKKRKERRPSSYSQE